MVRAMKIATELIDELHMLIGRLHRDSPQEECGVFRKASELYGLILNLQRVKPDSLILRRRKLGLSQEHMAILMCVRAATVQVWEQEGAPYWVGPLLDTLEERRRDEERRDYLGINAEPEA